VAPPRLLRPPRVRLAVWAQHFRRVRRPLRRRDPAGSFLPALCPESHRKEAAASRARAARLPGACPLPSPARWRPATRRRSCGRRLAGPCSLFPALRSRVQTSCACQAKLRGFPGAGGGSGPRAQPAPVPESARPCRPPPPRWVPW